MSAPEIPILHRFGRTGRSCLHGGAGAAFVFLYLPMVMLVVFSFNENDLLVFPPTGFSLKWYAAFFANSDIQRSLWNSIVVVLGCVPLTLLVGVPVALAFDRYPIPFKGLLEQVTLLPLIVPGLLTGLAILLTIKRVDAPLSLATVVLGHSVGWLPVVIVQVYARLRRFDRRLEEASLDLGANPLQTFRFVTLPNIASAVIGSAVLVTTLSLNEVAITFFLTGTQNTLPMHIWSMLREGVTPEINAIATLSMIFSFVAVFVVLRLLRRGE